MGFGWMFLGYLMMAGTNIDFFGIPVDVTPDIVGFLLLLHGFNVAGKYCDDFKIARIFAIVGIPLSLTVTAVDMAINLEYLTLSPTLTQILSWGYDIFKLAFAFTVVASAYWIATEVGVMKVRKKAIRCFIYTGIFFVFTQFLTSILSLFGVILTGEQLTVVTILCDAVGVLLNASLIFSCYMWICLEGDEDMPDNRTHKYKTPFDYFDAAKARDAQNQKANPPKKHKKK